MKTFDSFSSQMAASTPNGDGRVNSRIENYTEFWQKDMHKEEKADTDNRVDSYTDVVNGAFSDFHGGRMES